MTARLTDPRTSHAAAHAITGEKGTRHAVLEILRTLGPMPDEYLWREHTCLALCEIVPRRLSPQRIRTVRAGLTRDGLVEDSGWDIRLDGARCRSIIWKATE